MPRGENTIPFAEGANSLYIEGLSGSDLAVLRRALATIYDNVQRGRSDEPRHRPATKRR